MLSRVAESIYWMNRYMERAENVARFLEVSLGLALDLPTGHPEPWPALVSATGEDEAFGRTYGAATQAAVVEFLTFDRDYHGSIYSCLRCARENARAVRGALSDECLEQINKAFLFVSDPRARDRAATEPHAFYAAVKQGAQLVVAVSYLTMTHDEGWHFGRLARLVERADQTSRILDVKHFILSLQKEKVSKVEASTYDEIQWAALLRCASGLETYRRRHGLVEPARVVEFLLFEPKFPRSVRYCLTKGERSLHAITRNPSDSRETPAEAAFAELRERFARGGDGAKEPPLGDSLHLFVDDLQRSLATVGQAIHETFFTLGTDRDEASGSLLPPAESSQRTSQ